MKKNLLTIAALVAIMLGGVIFTQGIEIKIPGVATRAQDYREIGNDVPQEEATSYTEVGDDSPHEDVAQSSYQEVGDDSSDSGSGGFQEVGDDLPVATPRTSISKLEDLRITQSQVTETEFDGSSDGRLIMPQPAATAVQSETQLQASVASPKAQETKPKAYSERNAKAQSPSKARVKTESKAYNASQAQQTQVKSVAPIVEKPITKSVDVSSALSVANKRRIDALAKSRDGNSLKIAKLDQRVEKVEIKTLAQDKEIQDRLAKMPTVVAQPTTPQAQPVAQPTTSSEVIAVSSAPITAGVAKHMFISYETLFNGFLGLIALIVICLAIYFIINRILKNKAEIDDLDDFKDAIAGLPAADKLKYRISQKDGWEVKGKRN